MGRVFLRVASTQQTCVGWGGSRGQAQVIQVLVGPGKESGFYAENPERLRRVLSGRRADPLFILRWLSFPPGWNRVAELQSGHGESG